MPYSYQTGIEEQAKNTVPVLAIPTSPAYRFGMNGLKHFRELKDWSQERLADEVGTSQPQIARLEKEKRKLSKEWAVKLAPPLGVTAEDLMFFNPKQIKRKKGQEAEAVADWSHNVEMQEIESRAGGGSAGAEQIVEATTENGFHISADAVRDRWSMPLSFVRGELRISSGQAAVVEMYGDSMYDPSMPNAPGSLMPGDRVIVDTGDKNPSPPGAFLVWDGVGLVVKLVDVVRGSEPPRIRLSSRNPGYKDYEATQEEATIIGRIRGRISSM